MRTHYTQASGQLKMLFLPNYRASAMEKICIGADLSEQISTAGKEASGTGNMKFMLNGAVTIGTLDGANVEILKEVNADNFFLFGLDEKQVAETRSRYNPAAIIAALKNPHDPWMTIADFRSFIDTQKLAGEAYQDQKRWAKMSIINTACSGKFSVDRTIAEYASDIWGITVV